mmetsp:Transcript_8516/g.53231  ORF Transcript_8516/g.53231 Transcript_8516/m.53231 type:complete len:95 (+) Transcript_8516:447-731(+)
MAWCRSRIYQDSPGHLHRGGCRCTLARAQRRTGASFGTAVWIVRESDCIFAGKNNVIRPTKSGIHACSKEEGMANGKQRGCNYRSMRKADQRVN